MPYMSSIVKDIGEVGMKFEKLLFGSSKNKMGYTLGQNTLTLT